MILLLWLGMLGNARAADSLVWRAFENKVDAQIESWTFDELLERMSAATGWQIFVEPDAGRPVPVTFKNLEPGEALRRLLGNLNFALLPQNEGPAKLLIYRTSLQEATKLIPMPIASKADATKRRVLGNELIVMVKPGAKDNIRALAERFGAKIVGGLDDLDTYRLQFKDEASAKAAREALAASPDQFEVDSNYAIGQPGQIQKLQYSSTPPFNLRPKISTDSSRVVIGLVDTGVQPLRQDMNQFLLPSVQVAGEPLPAKEPTHGTSMAETILRGLSFASKDGDASPVRILPVDVYGPNPETSTFDVAKGVYTAINSGATIVNLSMGGDGDSKLLSNMIRDAYKQGVLFFGAAGNQPTTLPTYPAAYSEVVAVTAGDKKGILPYANRGNFVDVVAPGLSVVDFNGQSYLISGTSASTAYVSGTAAAIRADGQNSGQVEAQIREKLAVPTQTKR